MVDIAVVDGGQDQRACGIEAGAFGGDGIGAEMVDLEWEMMAVLFDRAGGDDGDFVFFNLQFPTSDFQSFVPSIVCLTHHQYSSSVSPFQAKTGIP